MMVEEGELEGWRGFLGEEPSFFPTSTLYPFVTTTTKPATHTPSHPSRPRVKLPRLEANNAMSASSTCGDLVHPVRVVNGPRQGKPVRWGDATTSYSDTTDKGSLTFTLSATLKPGVKEVVENILSRMFSRAVKVSEPAPSSTRAPKPYVPLVGATLAKRKQKHEQDVRATKVIKKQAKR